MFCGRAIEDNIIPITSGCYEQQVSNFKSIILLYVKYIIINNIICLEKQWHNYKIFRLIVSLF